MSKIVDGGRMITRALYIHIILCICELERGPKTTSESNIMEENN